MTDEVESRLRGSLRRAGRGLPDNPERYDEVAGRVRRRRRTFAAGLAGAAAALAIVVAGGIFALGGDGDDTVVAGQDRDVTALSCPSPSGGPGEPGESSAGGFVREGAVAARLCPGQPSGRQDVAPDARLTAVTLHTGIGSLVERLNALPATKPDPICTDDLGPVYDLVLAYSDGRRVTVSFESYGCGVAKSGDDFRMGATRLDETVSDLVQRQKAAEQPSPDLACPDEPGTVPTPKSPGPAGDFVADGATAARVCAPDDPELHGTTLNAKDAERLTAALRDLPDADPQALCTMELGPTYDLVLGYPEGHRSVVTFQGYGCGFAKAGERYRMDAREIRDLLASAKPAQPKGLGCPKPSGGPDEVRADSEPGPIVPDGAVAARACPGAADQPAENLSAVTLHDGVDELAAFLNGRPVAAPDQGCRDVLGPLYDVVFGYPDGSRIVVRVEVGGCGVVQAGDLFRSGGSDFRQVLEELVAEE